jgi:hypothetical protein
MREGIFLNKNEMVSFSWVDVDIGRGPGTFFTPLKYRVCYKSRDFYRTSDLMAIFQKQDDLSEPTRQIGEHSKEMEDYPNWSAENSGSKSNPFKPALQSHIPKDQPRFALDTARRWRESPPVYRFH